MEKITKKSFLEKIQGESHFLYGAYYRPEVTLDYIATYLDNLSGDTLGAFPKRKTVKVNDYSIVFEYQEDNKTHTSTLGLNENGSHTFFEHECGKGVTFLVIEHEYMGFDLQTREDRLLKGYCVYAKA